MDDLEQLPPFPEDFSGLARLFPLPNLVLFPGVIQPLRVFESRYVEMLEDALAGDRLIAMALLQPGYEDEYVSRPPVAPTICIGQVLSEMRDDEGCYNFLLAGQKRARIIRELPAARSYRQAEVELLHDCRSTETDIRRQQLKSRLVQCFCDVLRANNLSNEQIKQFLDHDVPLGALADVIAFSAPIDVAHKQYLLNQSDVIERAEALLIELEDGNIECDSSPNNDRPFPPPFSVN